MLDLWYKNAIIYCLDVEVYMDGNGDGIGDFEGLKQRLNYIAGLGVTCIWLNPFFPTPNRDDGYDVMDYYNVDPRLGNLGDFVEFIRHARERGLRVIIDLVVNHTSVKHPWFQAARADPDSPCRDFYIWSDEKPADADKGVIFPGVQESTWTYDEQAKAYYFHRFYKHQADLNITNPKVRAEIYKIMGFWLELGVSGFRIDAAPFLIELRGIEDSTQVSDPYEYLKEMRSLLSWRRGDAILLAEANVEAEKVIEYFGDGNKLHLLFHFIANQGLILGLAREKAQPLAKALQAPPSIPQTSQWAQFVRNHDELSLDKLSQAEREEIAAEFAPDEDMWIYDRGIRRRMRPLLQGDDRRLKLAYSLMLTLPGTPVIRYGEEIGMGDNLSLKERNSVRTPMQWSDEKNAGFSHAAPEKLVRPIIDQGKYSYKQLNVEAQRRDPHSFLNWIERAIGIRKYCPEFGWGEWQILETGNEAVFAHRCIWQGNAVIALHNLSHEACTVELDLKEAQGKHSIDLLEDKLYEPISDPYHQIELEGYGYRWLRIGEKLI
ncbi:MAG: alpha-amylase family protein [Oscillatoria sp. PMC 1051.18]|nr:alpha-amylase family protein [Oscillatoria sp. PMC 1050.18]MEC5031692.1 alpha-amylase family protein [Oscillatoria sp. PMC 1051.18]